MAGKFREELKAALDRFDIHRAEALSEKLRAAEEQGYEVTTAELRLWDKLLRCVESFRRTMCSLD